VSANGRRERIRTSGPHVPNVVLYQAELLSEFTGRPPLYRGGFGAATKVFARNFTGFSEPELAGEQPDGGTGTSVRYRTVTSRSVHGRNSESGGTMLANGMVVSNQ
jgi:hypothetical protein